VNQKQRKTLKIVNEISQQYRDDPVGWANRYISFEGLKLSGLTWQQEEIAHQLVKNRYVCVSAGGGIGKTAVSAILILWFLTTHPFAKVPTTAPTAKQLNDVLWSEIDTWLKRCRLAKLFKRVKGRLYVEGFREWYATARTVSKDKRELNDTLAGFHAPSILIEIDEASGVPDPVFTALVGTMTDRNSYILLISNPVSTGGFYYDVISDPEGKGKDFKVLFYNVMDSPLVDEEFIQTIINIYGKDSPMYRAKVLGLPIDVNESVVVAPEVYDKVVATQRSMTEGPVILSVDVAGGGPDVCVFCHRIGNSFVRWDEFYKTDPTFVADEVERIWRTMYVNRPFCAVIDAHGLGAGTYSNLAKLNRFPVLGFVGPEKAHHQLMYKDKRAENYYKLHKNFPTYNFPVDPPERLKKELANLRFDYSKGPIAMEDKIAFKARLGFSPDYADAMMMTEAVENFLALTACRNVPAKAVSIFRRLHTKKRSHKFGKYRKFIV